MGYRNIQRQLIHIDSLVRECGLFCNTDLNNGYGCKSKSKDKAESGCCYEFDCPLAHNAELEDLKELDEYLYNEYKDDKYEPHEQGSGWMVQFREVV